MPTQCWRSDRASNRCRRLGSGCRPAPINIEELDWAEVIFVMERSKQRRLSQGFGAQLRGKRVVCLDTPDNYVFMQPELVALLEKRVGPHLRG